MTYDATYLNTIHAGAKALITAAVPAVSSGLTFTISGTPTFTLLKSDGTTVFGPVNVTGNDTSAQPSPTAWYLLDTTSPQTLAAGAYVGVFTVAYSDNATPSRAYVEKLEAQVVVLPPVEVAATYDPTTPAGQVRLLAADTNAADPVWSDVEIAQALSWTGGNVFLAAGLLLDTAAADASKLAIITRLGRDLGDLSRIPEMLRASAEAVRKRTAALIQTNAPDQVFSTDSSSGTVEGTTTVW